MFLNFAKSCPLSCLSKDENIKKITQLVFELYAPRTVIKGVFSRLTVAMATYCVTKMITRSPMVKQLRVAKTTRQNLSTENCFEPR